MADTLNSKSVNRANTQGADPEPEVDVKEEPTSDVSVDDDDGPSVEELMAEYQRKYFSTPDDKPKTVPEPTATPAANREQILQEIRDELSKPKAGQDPTFRDFIAKGDFEGAEDYLYNKTASRLSKNFASLEEKMAMKMKEAERELLDKAINGALAKNTLDTKINDIIKQNPELKGFTDFIEYKSNEMVGRANIQTVQQYISAKSDAYDLVVNELKSQLSGVKGKGKQEALRVKEKTLSSQPVSGISAHDSSPGVAKNEQARPQSPSDYVAMRRNQAAKQRGLIED